MKTMGIEKTVGIAVICKTPEPGKSKTRLSPPLTPGQCADISACFIRDLTANIQALCEKNGFSGYAVYTPLGSETELGQLLPAEFGLILQSEGDLGARLLQGTRDILAEGHAAAIIINADSPTLPMAMLEEAAEKLLDSDCVVLGPAIDGGYTFIGLSQPHARLFEDIPWSTEAVHGLTEARAAEISLPVHNTPPWYDVDDASTLAILRSELDGEPPPFAHVDHVAEAPATSAYLDQLGWSMRHQMPLGDTSSSQPDAARGRTA